jgi:hypothetical protein
VVLLSGEAAGVLLDDVEDAGAVVGVLMRSPPERSGSARRVSGGAARRGS